MIPAPIARHLPTVAAWVVLIGLFVIAGLREPVLFEYYTIRNIVAGASILGVIAIGMTFVIISGGIDLSVGAILGCTCILIGVLIDAGWHPFLAWMAAILVGTAGGALSGTIIHVFRLPAFIVTLGAMFLFRGIALLISERSVSINHPIYERLGLWGAGPVPPVVIIFAGVALVGWVLSRWTRFGRTTYAIGGRESSARLMGLPVASTKIRIYAFSGCCAAIAGIATTMYTLAGKASAGELAELDAIAAVVIGGTPLSGGVGAIGGTIAGALVASLIQELITFADINSWWTKIAVGGLLLAFILLQRVIQSRAT